MRSSTPHLMLALCTMAVQAAPISPAPRTPDVLTMMTHGEVDARDTRDTNNLDVNDYRKRSTSGFSNESEVQHNNAKRSIGGYSYPAGTNAVGRSDEMPTTPGLTTRAPREDSDADLGFDSDSASNSDSDSGFDSDSDNQSQGQGRVARMEVREVSADQDAADFDDEFSNDMFEADGDDEFSNDMFEADGDDEFEDDFDNDSDVGGDDLQTRHAEIKRSIDAFLQEDYALERRHQHSNTNEDRATRGEDSETDSASESDFSSDSDSYNDYSRSKSQNSASAVKANAVGASQVNTPADKQQDSLKASADAGESGSYRAQVEDPQPAADAKLEMI